MADRPAVFMETEDLAEQEETSPPVELVSPKPGPTLAEFADFLKGPKAVPLLAVVGIFGLLFLAFLYFARSFILPVVLATVLSFLFRPVVKMLCHLRIPQPVGAAMVLAVAMFLIGNGVSYLSRPASEMIEQLPNNIRRVEAKFWEWLPSMIHLKRAANQVTHPGQEETEQPPKVEIKSGNYSDALFSYTTSFLAGALETIVLLYFLLASGQMFMQKLVKVLPSFHDKKNAVEIAHEVQENISRFLFTITVINACLGTCVGVVLFFFGMSNALLWGVAAAMLNFLPYFGPIIGVALLTLAGLVHFDSVALGLMPPAIYLGLHTIEANFITPTVIGKRLTLNPVVIFVSLMFWMWLWGVPGAVLAVPLLMIIKIFCDHFKPLAPFGEFLSGSEDAH
jgi:predicted PurR-regulated permease PerM